MAEGREVVKAPCREHRVLHRVGGLWTTAAAVTMRGRDRASSTSAAVAVHGRIHAGVLRRASPNALVQLVLLLLYTLGAT